MTHVVHPYSFRLGIVRNWKSRWFNVKKYKTLLRADVLVREFLDKRLRGMYVDTVEIERTPNAFHIILQTSRPGLVIGRKGEGVEKLKQEILKLAKKNNIEFSGEFKLTVEEVRHPDAHAAIVSQVVAENLEKRLPFRRVIKQTLDKIMANREVKGCKIALSGRLGGAEMSRREWLSKGQMPLQTLTADIDFAREKAHLPYGDIGIKVWIYRVEEENIK